MLEHPPVITVGLNSKVNNVLVNEEFLVSKGVTVIKTNRGGDVTYHGPGQIVGYPILNLDNHGKDVKAYIRRLEEIFIRLLEEQFDLQGERNPAYPGVWIKNEKITAIGCSIKRWVTMHGFAFNVNTDLEYFRWINPCGFTDRGVTSLQKLLGSLQDMEKVMDFIIDDFSNLFCLKPEIYSKEIFLKRIEELSNAHT